MKRIEKKKDMKDFKVLFLFCGIFFVILVGVVVGFILIILFYFFKVVNDCIVLNVS